MPPSNAKLVSDIVDRIHAKIVSGEYKAGLRLRQEVLADEFKVSRTPIREALRQLEAKGVISQAHRHSAVVRAPSSRDIRETYQIRAELEGLAAQLAAQWISDEQLDRLRQIHDRFVLAVKNLSAQRAAGQRAARSNAQISKASKEWIETNSTFHTIIHEASNSLCLQRFIRDLNLGYTRNIMQTSALGMDLYRMQQNIAHHDAILRGLERRDPVEARRATVQHILESGEFVVAWFENQTAQS